MAVDTKADAGIEKAARDLMRGAVDLHVHCDPSIVLRSVDAFQVAETASAAGMRAVVIKDHQSPTEPAAWLAQRYAKIQPPFEIFGSTLLNNSVGGYNVFAVEKAIIMGARMIMCPTLASPASLSRRVKPGELSSSAMKMKAPALRPRQISTLDESGRLLPEVLEVLDRIAQSDVILATGHLNKQEAWALVRAAKERGVRRISITHALTLIQVSPEELREFCRETGAIAERTAHEIKKDGDQAASLVRCIGLEHLHYSSDGGYIEVPKPIDGYAQGIEILLRQGLSEKEITQITHVNPADLLGISRGA